MMLIGVKDAELMKGKMGMVQLGNVEKRVACLQAGVSHVEERGRPTSQPNFARDDSIFLCF